MKEGDIVRFKEDFEFEAFDEEDNPIGMRTLLAGTKAIVSEDTGDIIYIYFADKDWNKDWGDNNTSLSVEIDILEVCS